MNYKYIMKFFYEWVEWESIMHNFIFVFFVYIIYLFFILEGNEQYLSNVILFTILCALMLQIHQTINDRNKQYPEYKLNL